MRQIFFFVCTLCTLFFFGQTNAQNVTVTGATNTTPNLAATYTSLAGAVTALNSITAISGPVTIALASAYKETAPAGGFSISFTAATNATDTIVIDGGSSYDTLVANSSLTAGALNDAVFKIIGSDYVTIKRFTMLENTANTTTTLASNNMTEWGVALLRRSATDGAQHNTIIDNTISLDRTYANTFGIYSNVRHSATVVGTTSDITNVTGSNHDNIVYYNRISNVNMGIAFIGSNTDARMDAKNDIGGTSSATGNSITNWGGNSLVTGTFAGNVSTEYYGILMRCQKDDNTSWNTLTGSTSLSGSVAAPIKGIHKGTTTGTVTGSFSTTIDHNTVTITDNLPNGSSSMSRVDGIFCTDKLASATLSISNNTITGLAVTTANSNRQIRGINNTASTGTLYINNNTIKGNTSTATATGGWFIGIDQTGSVTTTLEINNNLIGDNSSTTPAITYSATANGSTIVRGISNDQSGNPTASVSINSNSLYGFVQANSPTNSHSYIYCDHTTTTNSNIHIDGNHFVNIDAHITGDVIFINSPGTMATSAGAQLSVSNNDIVGTFTKSLAGGDVYIYNASGSSSTGNTMTESGNNFSNISLTGSTVMHGWYNNEGATAAGPEKHITNNTFDTWTCGTSGTTTTNVIYCNWASGNSEISGNAVSNITAPADVNGILSASSTTTTLHLNSDKVGNIKSSGSGFKASLYKLGGGSGDLFVQNSHGISEDINSGNGTLYCFSFGPGVNFANIYVNYCTFYLNITTTTGAFNTGIMSLPANGTSTVNRAYIRNNILVNRSSGGTGLTVALWRTAAALDNFDASSDNNDYYAGTPGTANLIYYDGTNPQQTVAAYRSFITQIGSPLNATNVELASLSLSVNPDFQSTLYSAYNVLRLVTTSVVNCPLFKAGNNNGIGLATDIDGQPRMITSPYITDIGWDEVTFTNTWIGSGNPGDWNDPLNWSLNVVPDDIHMSVYIPNVTPTYQQPVLPISYPYAFQVDDVRFETGLSSTLLPLLTNNYWLKIAGTISGDNGSFDNTGSTFGSIEMNGVCSAQTIDGSIFVGKAINNFTASNDVTVSTAASFDVYGELGFGSVSGKVLATSPLISNPGLTLKSISTRTANVAPITNSNTITGNVTVERYIHTGQDPASTTPPIPAQHTKSWQFLATPTGSATSGNGQTIHQSWQENGVSPSVPNGLGTWIVGPGTGFDAATPTPSTASVQNWDPTGGTSGTGDWVDVTNTGQQLYDQRGYQVLVRGDRSAQVLTSLPSPTVMRSKGPLYEPGGNTAPTSSVLATGAATYFTSVGNPYASPVDLGSLFSSGFTNIDDAIYVWDPLLYGSLGLGGYQLLTQSSGFDPSPGGTDYYPSGTSCSAIQSGQAFFVSSAAGGSVSFSQAVKTPADRLVNRNVIRNTNVKRKIFKATLYTSQGWIADGNRVVFDDCYSNKVDNKDAAKLFNPGENFVLVRENKNLAQETRSEIGETDSIFYNFSNLQLQTYQLRFAPENIYESGLNAYLVDKYSGTNTKLSLKDSSFVDFAVNDDKSSYTNRFIVVFKRGPENLAQAKDENAVKNSLIVYPNPAQNKTIKFRFVNSEPGNYTLQLVNHAGQLVYSGNVQINDKSTLQSISLGNNVASGNYELKATLANGETMVQQVMIR